VIVRDAAGNLITQFSYGGSTGLEGDNNQSLTRSPDVTGAFVQHTASSGANGQRIFARFANKRDAFRHLSGHLTSVTISPQSGSITVGQTQQFTAQAFDEYGRVMTNATINFASDNTNVATVESVTMNSTTGIATASVKGRSPGTAHITASATDGVITVNSTPATLTVTGPSLSINDASHDEGDAGATAFTFTVSLSTPAPIPVTFDIATQDNTATVSDGDYVSSLTDLANDRGGCADLHLRRDGDRRRKYRTDRDILCERHQCLGAGVSDSQGVGTIITDDVPKLSVNDVAKLEGNSGTTTYTFTVSSTLPAPPGGVTFDIATHDNTATISNSDYIGRTLASQSIPAGQSSYAFDVTVNGDTLVEPNETFFVNISNVSANASVSDSQGIGTIQNDDAASLVISQVYGGGNNSGALFQNDFVEIFNRGTTTVDFSVTPYSIQYAGVGSNFGSSKTDLISGAIAPSKYFLIKESGGTTNGLPLPAAMPQAQLTRRDFG
jgi:hypothetical protein